MNAQLVLDHVLAAGNVPDTPVKPVPGLETLGPQIVGYMKWILILCGVGGLVACGIMMTVGRRNRSAMASDGAAGIPWVIGGLMLGGMSAVIVGAFL
ncbi:hypothetical protein ACWT_5799 [Actinoplanes sp. SE50]|uniref:hypothetical protein n=1 Tax=unclassified Actinoplanes TaxID=2626549 RepID=UPI00023ED69B|nr:MULTISPECIES: hypothetical protein [unclassified Actinoplanes]AEV86817.1 hypothetical protein ACPL_5930 [Actinoplanes sp. SE50/110]ATO85214.1 hypothetical protein ACWT_5799 [Actinoplanes sp. SE50]SLM02624.1 hypothetical protein ACSP50_5906 [Actinoplanes sp. SE50/110]